MQRDPTHKLETKLQIDHLKSTTKSQADIVPKLLLQLGKDASIIVTVREDVS
jgi:hypothetical protein